MATFDPEALLNGAVALFGGSGALALMWTFVRKRMARDQAEASHSRGESHWIKRQQDELAEKELEIKVLTEAVKDREETITELRMKVLVLEERNKRQRSHIQRVETMLIDLRPDMRDWMSSDHSPLGPPEID